ncbi:hypothetical protein GC1_00021 [Gluconobacter phage GC1]|uniref:Uncharacterized protein n=1 Tax=Gluconobacter phage GC1 TaxID=2047788 RepID=A0A2I5AR89_9VIRU|nr:hypothetical protein FDJ08_gp21 [Gluconobacter phage GC1]ATS92589.1 hypothetical protein GC1_00021 [Gluconobacter phage GC1]
MAYDHRKTYPSLSGNSQVIVQPASDAASRMTFLDPHAAHRPSSATVLMERKASAKNSADID